MSDHDGENPGSTPEEDEAARQDRLADEMSEESFPDSDPPSTWAGPDRKPVNREESGNDAP